MVKIKGWVKVYDKKGIVSYKDEILVFGEKSVGNKEITIAPVDGWSGEDRGYSVSFSENHYQSTTATKRFKTKAQAMTFAKLYMKKNPKGWTNYNDVYMSGIHNGIQH